MNRISLKPVVAAAVMAVAAIGQAQAAPGVFTIDPLAIPGTVAPATSFQADSLIGASSELLRATGPTTFSASFGWVRFSTFNLGGNPVLPTTTGLLTDYNLYLTFDITTQLASGTMFGLGSTYNVTSLNVRVLADPNLNTTFAQASTAAGGTDASVAGTADDIVLATSSLLTGTASVTALGGVAINTTSLFAVCTGAGTADVNGAPVANAACASGAGASYFAQPVPFYALSLTAFNNTGSGVTIDPTLGLIAISTAGGTADFNVAPEPTGFALAGLALLAAGAASRRRRTNG